MNAPNGLGRLYTADELAEQLGRSRRWVYRAVEEHGLHAVRVGRSLYVHEADVAAWLNANRTGAAPVPIMESDSRCPIKEKAPAITEAPKALLTEAPTA